MKRACVHDAPGQGIPLGRAVYKSDQQQQSEGVLVISLLQSLGPATSRNDPLTDRRGQLTSSLGASVKSLNSFLHGNIM